MLFQIVENNNGSYKVDDFPSWQEEDVISTVLSTITVSTNVLNLICESVF